MNREEALANIPPIPNLLPKVRDSVVVFSREGKSLYLEPSLPDWLVVEAPHERLLKLCDGQTSVSKIVSTLKEGNEQTALLVARQFSEAVMTSGVFENATSSESAHSPEDQPKYYYLTLTDRCNLRCAYCYAKDRKPAPEISCSQWMNYIDQFHDMAPDATYTITGGEPLFYPHVFEVASYLRKKGAPTVLITNGTLIDAEIAAKITDTFSEVKLSIDTTDEAINLKLRTVSPQSTIRVSQLLEHFGKRPSILATVTQANMDHLDGLVEAFGDRLVFQPLFPMGRAVEHEDLAITGKQYFQALSKPNVRKFLPGYYGNIHGYRCQPYKRCALAREEISIGPNGDVFGCHLMHYQSLCCGNLEDRLFEEIYVNSPMLTQLRKLNVDSIQNCSKCNVRNFCGAACRARIGIKGIMPNEHDDFCEFERLSILDALFSSCNECE